MNNDANTNNKIPEGLKNLFSGLDAYIEANFTGGNAFYGHGPGNAMMGASMASASMPLASAASFKEPSVEKTGFFHGLTLGQPLTGKLPGKRSARLSAPIQEDFACREPDGDDSDLEEACFDVCEDTGSSEPDEILEERPCLISPDGRHLEDVIGQVSETWSESLLRIIDDKGLIDAEVYKKARVDRKLFSKIRSNPSYQPKKITAVAFALALELNLDETKDLLSRAGYALSPSSVFDLIIQYFIENDVHDIYAINMALYDHDQPLIGE